MTEEEADHLYSQIYHGEALSLIEGFDENRVLTSGEIAELITIDYSPQMVGKALRYYSEKDPGLRKLDNNPSTWVYEDSNYSPDEVDRKIDKKLESGSILDRVWADVCSMGF